MKRVVKDAKKGTDAVLDSMIARLHDRSESYGKGSAYEDLRATCAEIDARRLEALVERNECRGLLARLLGDLKGERVGSEKWSVSAEDMDSYRKAVEWLEGRP